MALRYRLMGEILWHDGRVENISRSGVLFRAEHALTPNKAVEMSFVLPVQSSSEPGAEVTCHGHIVRTVLAKTTEGPALAATISDYCFSRRRRDA